MKQDAVIERLAELEHEQWVHWTKYFLENLTDKNIRRWKRQIKTPYKKLTEKEKQSDRYWARLAYILTTGCVFCGNRWGEETEGIHYFNGNAICFTCWDKIKKECKL